MSPPVVPGNGGRTGPSTSHAEDLPSAGPSRSGPNLAGHPVPLVSRRARVLVSLRTPLAPALERLGRLVPGTDAVGAAQPSARMSAGHRALQSAMTREVAEVLAAAAALASSPVAERGDAAMSDARPVKPVVEPTQTRGLAADSPVTETGPEAEAARPRGAWATPPSQPAEQSAAPVGEAPEESPAPPRRRQPGDTAPGFLLRTPTSVTRVADDFFDGLIRRVEGDR